MSLNGHLVSRQNPWGLISHNPVPCWNHKTNNHLVTCNANPFLIISDLHSGLQLISLFCQSKHEFLLVGLKWIRWFVKHTWFCAKRHRITGGSCSQLILWCYCEFITEIKYILRAVGQKKEIKDKLNLSIYSSRTGTHIFKAVMVKYGPHKLFLPNTELMFHVLHSDVLAIAGSENPA